MFLGKWRVMGILEGVKTVFPGIKNFSKNLKIMLAFWKRLC